jgi:hypothetical protein
MLHLITEVKREILYVISLRQNNLAHSGYPPHLRRRFWSPSLHIHPFRRDKSMEEREENQDVHPRNYIGNIYNWVHYPNKIKRTPNKKMKANRKLALHLNGWHNKLVQRKE